MRHTLTRRRVASPPDAPTRPKDPNVAPATADHSPVLIGASAAAPSMDHGAERAAPGMAHGRAAQARPRRRDRGGAASEPGRSHPQRNTLTRGGGEAGLTTLEWLLIVAAVAGLAALAVVMVQNVVSDTSEQIAGSSAREVAAKLAGEQVVTDSRRPRGDQPLNARTWRDWKAFYESRCKRINITYSDVGITATPTFDIGSQTGDFEHTKVNDNPSGTHTVTAECKITVA